MLSNIRNRAKDIFSKIGYPSTKEEKWKYTSLKNFNDYESDHSSKIDYKLDKANLSKESINIILCNGELITKDINIDGVKIQNYEDLVSSKSSKNFLKLFDFTDNGVIAHNTSSFTDALYLSIDSGKEIDIPINIINVTSDLGSDRIIFPRVYIHINKNSSSKIYIQHINDGAGCAVNSVFEFYCESSSKLEIIQLSNLKNQELIDSIFFHQEANSQIKFLSTIFGGKLYRSNIEISINGEGCNNNFGVLMLGTDKDHIDYHVNINHISGQSTNNFNCKSLLKDSSIGIFNGKILVAKGASGTDSTLNNNNLLLSDKSEIQSNPQLEINCKDVKCAHGFTSGNLDKDALFYLQSRGINKQDARAILIQGFISKLITHFDSGSLCLEKRIEDWI